MLLEQGQTDLETINAVFRAVHSVKGGAGAFGLEALVRFAHVFETLMDELRGGRKPCDAVTIKTLLRASDVLADHIQAAQGLAPPVDEERSAGLVQELELLTHGGEAPPAVEEEEEDDFGFTPMAFDAPLDDPALAVEATAADAAPSGQPGWRIVFKPHGRMYGSANEAGLLLREVGRLGPITVSVDEAALPTLDVLVAEDGYLTWTIDLVADVDEKAVREVFDFVEADCDLTITPLGGAPALVFEEEPPAVLPASDELDIAALLAKAAAGAAPETPAAAPAPAPALQSAALQSAAPQSVAPQSVAPQSVTPEPVAPAPVAAQVSAPEPAPVPAAAPIPPAQVATPVAPAPVTIRVDLDRVDRLINVVGELVIQQAMLSQRVLESGLARSSGIALGMEDLELLTREIQDSVMAIRAQPVKSVFQRMPRLVREVADMVSKQVRLVTSGEDTEVDKTVVERLAEPITHMLRNAIDHGLETPEERIAAGKPAEGTVRLAALHRSGRIVIEIADDGRGINRERVKKIAVDKGLIAADAALTD